MDVPRELKDYFRVGDQWLKVNENELIDVRSTEDYVHTSEKTEVIYYAKSFNNL